MDCLGLWHVYLVRCADGTLYCGITTDVSRRLAQHNGRLSGGARYTRARRPVELLATAPCADKSGALRLEAEVRRYPRAEKAAFLEQTRVAAENFSSSARREESLGGPMKTTQAGQPEARLYVCAHGVDETAKRLKKALVRSNLTLFAEFDHEKNARDVNLSLRPTRVLVFGSPVVGTHLMEACPAIAVELPLRMAIWEDAAGRTCLTFPPIDEVAENLGLAGNPIPGRMRLLLEDLAAEVSTE